MSDKAEKDAREMVEKWALDESRQTVPSLDDMGAHRRAGGEEVKEVAFLLWILFLLSPLAVMAWAVWSMRMKRNQESTHCKDCVAETTPGAGAARCPECWDSRCGAGKDGGIDG